MAIANFLIYCLSFVAIWFGAGLIIKSVDRIARELRLSSFAVSFFVLGILTSIPEMAVSINAVLNHKPEIFVGTLLGGTVVIFLLIIPILAILGRGVRINHDLNTKNLLICLAVIASPGLFLIDNRVTNLEGIIMLILYTVGFYFIQKKHGIFEDKHAQVMSSRLYSFIDLAKVGVGIGIVFVSSQFIVSQTFTYAQLLNIPAFYISIIILSLGTNLPELSIAIRAVISGKKDIAFGDYLGSASANTLLFGVFTLLNDGEVLTLNSFVVSFMFILAGLGLFYYFAQSQKDISRKEGVVLLVVYLMFVGYELSTGLMH